MVSDFMLTQIFFAGSLRIPHALPSSFYSISGETVDWIQKLDLVVTTPLQMFINILLIQGNLSSIEPTCN